MRDMSVGLFTQTCVFSLKYLGRFSLSSLATSRCGTDKHSNFLAGCDTVPTSAQTSVVQCTRQAQTPKPWRCYRTSRRATVQCLLYVSCNPPPGSFIAWILLFIVAGSKRGRNTTGSCKHDGATFELSATLATDCTKCDGVITLGQKSHQNKICRTTNTV